MRPDSLEHNNGERDSDLVAVELDIALHFDAHRIEGRVTNHIRGKLDGTRTIRFHAQDLAIESVHDAEGRALSFDLEPPMLAIELAEPLARGAEESLTIAYSAEPQKGLYFVGEAGDLEARAPEIWSQNEPEELRCWIPTWDYPSDRARFEARVRVDKDMIALSNGVLVGVEDHGGGEHTYHWKLDQEIPTYLIAIAAGRWEHYSDRWRDLPVDYYVAPGTGEAKARRAFGETPDMLEYFSTLLDEPFPYPKYAQVAVADFVMGGMENASLTIQNDDVVADEDQALDLDDEARLLVAHELAHQWFGDLVTCFGWSNLWLNEGWASYMELVYQGRAAGRENMRLWLERYRETYLASGPATRLPLSETWRSQASPSRCNHEYEKGPWVLYMMNRALGDDAFWKSAHAYLERHKNGFAASADFARAIFDESGKNVYALIQQWVEGAGHPRYRVSFDIDERASPANGGARRLRLRVRQVQTLDELVPLFDMPVTVAIYTRDRGRGASASAEHVTRRTIRVDEQDETFELAFDGDLVDVVFDDDCAVLCELALEKGVALWTHQSEIADNSAARWRAIDGLREAASAADAPDARRALIDRLLHDEQPLVRAKAAQACAFDEARGALLDALESDTDSGVRFRCARALRHRELDARESERMSLHLERERSPLVRRELLRLLGRIDAPRIDAPARSRS